MAHNGGGGVGGPSATPSPTPSSLSRAPSSNGGQPGNKPQQSPPAAANGTRPTPGGPTPGGPQQAKPQQQTPQRPGANPAGRPATTAGATPMPVPGPSAPQRSASHPVTGQQASPSPQPPNGTSRPPASRPAANPSTSSTASSASNSQPASRPGSASSVRSSPSPHPPDQPRIAEEDGIPLVAEVFENQRYYPIYKWSSKLLDRPSWSSEDGAKAVEKDDFRNPPGWTWAAPWEIDINDQTDADGWSYASDFTKRYKGCADPSLNAVRRRRHFRRRVPPAASVKIALGLNGGAKSNALTVGLVKNTLAVSNTVRSAGYSVRSHSNQNTVGGKPASQGGNPSLAALYTMYTVDQPTPSPPTAAATAAAAAANGNGSSSATPTPSTPNAAPSASLIGNGVLLGAASLPTQGDSTPGSTAESSASSTMTAALAKDLSGQMNGMSITTTDPAAASSAPSTSLNPSLDSPQSKPKYVPFSSLSFSNLTSGLADSFKSKTVKQIVKLVEYQRYYPIAGWSSRMLPTDNKGKGPWINESDGKKSEGKDAYVLTKDWKWTMDSWTAVIDSTTDLEGWQYAIEPTMQYHAQKGIEHFVRRRTWQREKQMINTGGAGRQKSYAAFFERLEYFKRDLKAEENDDEMVSMTSATW